MATISSGYTFVNNETVTPAKLNSLAGGATLSALVDADVSASAAIADTKLATIATAGKVANTATTATSANTASAIVARDASGNFSCGAITSSGNLSVTGTITASGNITAFSDERLKTNVETIADALSLVRRLRGVSYDRIDTGERQIGVIAQELQEVIPELVLPAVEAGYLSVAYGNITAVLIEAIKQLADEVEALKK